MIVPKTRDGRVVFMLPWQGATIAGTTDAPSPVTPTPRASEEDVAFILSAIKDYLAVQVRTMAASGARMHLLHVCSRRPLQVRDAAAD
jgi:glycerol-3-phosphate dehydrogenase